MTLGISPRFQGSQRDAIEYKLNGLKSEYLPGPDGILIGWDDLDILNDKGIILDDQPYIFWRVSFTAHLFRPSEGRLLKGKVHRIQKCYFIVKAMESFNVTVSIPEKLIDHPTVKQIMIDKEIYFKMKKKLDEKYRGELDEECIELTETLMNQELDDDKGIYEYAGDFEY